ncbi:hypothetical protein [Dyadobacter aurulentus]|uniref:hypothetical protein n=1 Tax=Dyadobacter sp. UC 10 TaxID=2605428 RepID=UPI0011F0AE38|nr:hypothetical protein [Dyadobacter sp. UC 10]KAA0990016.1 hypothetical protein FXO21_07510 [Dyadobacter sp. UC 10]
MLYGILPFGIKIPNECINNHKKSVCGQHGRFWKLPACGSGGACQKSHFTTRVAGKLYDYDASGTKHKYYAVNAADTVHIKYAGRFEYDKNNVVKRVHTTEGQVVRSGDTLRFDYFLKDHLGNVRVVFNELGSTLQQTDNNPFAIELSPDRALPQNTRNAVNRNLYNSKVVFNEIEPSQISIHRHN